MPSKKKIEKSFERFTDLARRKNYVDPEMLAHVPEARAMSTLGVGLLPTTPAQAPSEVAIDPAQEALSHNAQAKPNAAALDPSGPMPLAAGTPEGDESTQQIRRAYGQSPAEPPAPSVSMFDTSARVAAWNHKWQLEAHAAVTAALGNRR